MSQDPTEGPASEQYESTWLLLIGISLVALNLRPAIVSIAPLLDVIQVELGLSSAVVSLLTVIPVVLIGVFALSAPLVVSRVGHDGGIFWGVLLIGVGTIARLWGGNWAVLLATTLVAGVGIGIVQALLPAIVKSYFPGRAAFATGLYTVSLAVGATLASGLTVPISQFFGSWTAALAIWSLIAVLGLTSWTPIQRSMSRNQLSSTEDQQVPTSGMSISWREPMVWILTLFFVFNTAVFFSILTWLPPRFVELGWSDTAAGLVLTVFIIAALTGMLLIMGIGDRSLDRRVFLVPMLLIALIGIVGVTFFPETLPWISAFLLGFGTGSWFTIMLMLPVDYMATSEETGKLSAIATAGGYIIGGFAPFGIGVLNDLYGEFTIPFGVIGLFVLIGFGMSFLFKPK